MGNFFNPDNAFFTFMGKAFDMIVLNTMWLILCIPIVTIIPATTAMYYSVVKAVRRSRSYAWKEFFRSFKANFRQGSVLSILGVVAVFVMYIDFRYANLLIEQGESSGSTFFGIFFVIAFLLTSIFVYLCPVLSRFEMGIGGILKTAFFMAMRHFPTTIALCVLWVAMLLGVYILLPGMFFLPVVYVWISSFLMERVFKKYMPEKQEPAEGESEKDQWYLE